MKFIDYPNILQSPKVLTEDRKKKLDSFYEELRRLSDKFKVTTAAGPKVPCAPGCPICKEYERLAKLKALPED